MARSSALKFSAFDQMAAALIKAPEPVAHFITATPNAKDKLSAPVGIEMMNFIKSQDKTLIGSIMVWGTDGKARECKIDRLHQNKEQAALIGRALWAKCAKAGKEGTVIRFRAAGGFSPDRWFYTVE